ncbi:MAG: T9SS type A sorting domain-containing protein [Ignavibacteriae bacterium]|nr:T9SS type A sorting domain-containing protein [Ignavibacteriota bacterium]MCB9220323.1 T9SS type A sorting domain-containing protein [Ignavibacteria bacterium]
MKKLILVLVFMVPFVSLSNIWTKAEGPFRYVLLNKLFTFNEVTYISEISTFDYAYKRNKDGWSKLDTGFFADKGIVFYFDQKDDIIFSSIGRKMYLSYDAGKNWKKYDTLDANIRYNTVVIVDSTIFLQANEFACLHKLEKGSDTLEKVYLSDSKVDSLYADKIISYGDYIFAADRRDHFDGESKLGKFYISKDKGKTWKLSENMKEQINNLLYHNNTLLAFTDENKIFKSKDYGENWTNDTSINFDVTKAISYKNKIFACGSQINISTDNGVTWEVSINNGLDEQSCKDIIVNKDTLYYITKYGSIAFYSTDEGNQWVRSSPLTDDFALRSIIEVRDTLFSTGGLTINYSTDNGKSWEMYSDSLYYKYTFLNEITIRDSIFVAINDRFTQFFISTDYGKSWRGENLGIISSQGWIGDIIIMGNRILLTSGLYGNYISEDAGLTWDYFENEIFDRDLNIFKYFRLSETEIILYSKEGLYKTFNNGITWEFENTGSEVVRVHDNSYREGNNIYTMDFKTHELIKSTDLGRTWTNLKLNIEPDLYWLHIIPYHGYLILLTTTDVFVTNNDGKDWTKFEVDLLMPNGKDLYFYRGIISDEYLVLSSESGMWRTKLSDHGIEVKLSVESEIESNYLYTYPPYPNPAKSEVKVLFYWDINLPMTTDDISIYDITGKKIDAAGKLSLVKQESHYGNLIWDCSSVQPGIYLINIKHGTEEKAVKVVVE